MLFARVAEKFEPVIVTEVPTGPAPGVKEVIVGIDDDVNVKPASVIVPPGVVTDTLPDVPDATTAVMLVAETTLKELATVPPKLTAVAPVKFVPVMVTDVPTTPEVGVNDAIVGGEPITGLFLITETVLLPFATARSALPSPSRSPMATE